MSIWKTLRSEKPKNLETVFVLTRGNKIEKAFWSEENKRFFSAIGLVAPVSYKRWCREEDLIKMALEDLKDEKKL